MSYLINFLPESHRRRQARVHRGLIERAVIAAAGAAALWIIVTSMGSTRWLQNRAETLEQQARAAGQTDEQLAKLMRRQGLLKKQIAVQQELTQSIRHTQVISMMTGLAPKSMALIDLKITAQRRAPKSVEDPAKKKTSSRRNNRQSDKQKKPAPELLRIEAAGLAANDDDVADFIGALEKNPVFTQVKLHYVRPMASDQFNGREFRVTMQTLLDRTYQSLAQKPGDESNDRIRRGQAAQLQKEIAHAH